MAQGRGNGFLKGEEKDHSIVEDLFPSFCVNTVSITAYVEFSSFVYDFKGLHFMVSKI